MHSRDARDVIDCVYGPPVDVISSCMRGMIIPAPGHEFVGADLSNIEGRVLAWLAREDSVLDAFRAQDADKIKDIYVLTYAKAFGVRVEDVTDDQRQIGKVMVLALGYGGGAGAFASMAKNYGVAVLEPGQRKPNWAVASLTLQEVEDIKHAWRDSNPNICALWQDLEMCALQAVRMPGRTFKVKTADVRYTCANEYLWCQLPSGRQIAYRKPFIGTKTNPWTGRANPTLMFWAALGKNWVRQETYGGSLAENVTQAAAADVLIGGILRCEDAGLPVVLHVHDEIVTECPIGAVAPSLLKSIMTQVAPWMTDLPVNAKPWSGQRYQK